MAARNTPLKPSSCVIISGFTAIGKTWLANHSTESTHPAISGYEIVDLDSAQFAKSPDGRRGSEFKPAYLAKVEGSIAPNTIILVSTHPEIRSALAEQRLDYALAYPSDGLKEEWIKRLQARDSGEELVNLVRNGWSFMVDGCRAQGGCQHFVLDRGEYLADIIGDIIQHMNLPEDQN